MLKRIHTHSIVLCKGPKGKILLKMNNMKELSFVDTKTKAMESWHCGTCTKRNQGLLKQNRRNIQRPCMCETCSNWSTEQQ